MSLKPIWGKMTTWI